ncbi:MAG: hypothetical protein AUK44_02310 [Porphyromonadaceae bacterium CG2_30_38_12]|nr:MAG: hypothetical protein AUK44_02310 [Porphyromonadaceae bacterium CG2_30_38_12]
MKKSFFLLRISLMLLICTNNQAQKLTQLDKVINNFTPSKSIYFDWINRNWYGSNEKKIEANLKFFKWLHDEYGMKLDIYLMDAADVDQGPNCAEEIGLPAYGSLETDLFKRKFPNGFGLLANLAKSFDCRLGVWLGPDGYGNSDSEAQKRKDMLIKFAKEYNFALFKFDACCSDLSPENQGNFIETMKECRKYSPDLIVLNHRITLNEEARKQTTTFLWEGRETYVDVNISNETPAPHHRAMNLSRGLPPDLLRLTEDHGVCFSSALDAWDDDLILQAFNRNLILSPEIYGNPFLLSDAELPRLARIYNIHRLYNDIMVQGIVLPEEKYGKFAVSRGDSSTRLITLRNLSWQSIEIPITLDASVGLQSSGDVEVLQYHPVEKFMGTYHQGSEVKVTVLPFRTCLIKVSTKPNPELILKGGNYQVVKNIPKQPVLINLLGAEGEKVYFSLSDNYRKYKKASINGKDISSVLTGNKVAYTFPGKTNEIKYINKLGELQPSIIPVNSSKYIESCNFAVDNNPLEVRELTNSGQTKIAQVQTCRDVFFNDTLFTGIGVWDKYAFDGNMNTAFKVRLYDYSNLRQNNGSFRLDIGENKSMDKIVFKGIPANFNPERVEISTDLSVWIQVKYQLNKGELIIDLNKKKSFRYLRLAKSPTEVGEVEGISGKSYVNRDKWKASNLFSLKKDNDVKLCWKYAGKLTGIAKGAYLSVTFPVNCIDESAFAFMIVNGKVIAANNRAPSFKYNNWEHFSIPDKNFTFYIPVDTNLEGKQVEVMLLSTDKNLAEMKPEVYLCNTNRYEKAELRLE